MDKQQQREHKRTGNPLLPVIDCRLSSWSPWSTCSALCGNGRRTRSRHIIQMPQNGGKPCDKKLTRTQRCKELPACPSITSYVTSTPVRAETRNNNNKNHNHFEPISKTSLATQQGPIGMFPTITTSTTTASSSMMEDEDESKFAKLLRADTWR